MIRVMTPGDAVATEHLLAASPGAAQWSACDLLSLASANTRFWVAAEDGTVIAALAARTVADEAEILNLAVGLTWRRRGVGRALMATALAEAGRSGANRVFLEVRESNSAARAFYRSLGFVETSRRAAYYRHPVEDALVLSRSVDAPSG